MSLIGTSAKKLPESGAWCTELENVQNGLDRSSEENGQRELSEENIERESAESCFSVQLSDQELILAPQNRSNVLS